MTDINTDLNATIASAVQARIEASVAEALSGGEFFEKYVTAALSETIEVKDARGYGTTKVPFLSHTMQVAIRAATKAQVEVWISQNSDELEAAVATALRRATKTIAAQLVNSLTEAAAKTYGINVELRMPGRD